ncbi:MAG: ferric reductase-like transmembrane domain-containing protein [Acidimicrobiales bacterium]|nr:ferric reductase-like transmembrane domain-containing protein [Acidimicrobiales bacterium]
MGLLGVTTGPTALWYLSRGTGLVALVLLTATVVLGIVASVGWASPRLPRFASRDLHRNLSLFCLALLVAHIVTAVADGFAPIGYVASVLPFSSPYRPLWLAFGTLAFDLLLAVTVTSAVRRYLGQRAWRAVHWLAYACWPIAVLHGLGTGTDVRLGTVLLVNAACVAAVLAALGWRLVVGWPRSKAVRIAAGGAAVAFPIAVVSFVATGPLTRGWALRAGTPPSLLASVARSAASGAARPAAPSASTGLPTAPFSGTLNGSYRITGPDASGLVQVDIRTRLRVDGTAGTPLEIVLSGQSDRGGVAMTSSRVALGSRSGHIVSLDGDHLVALVESAGQPRIQLDIRLSLDSASRTVSGVVHGQSASSSAPSPDAGRDGE